MATDLAALHTLDAFETEARKLLPRPVYEYFRGGADQETTLRENGRAFESYRLWYRTLQGAIEPRLDAMIASSRTALPVLLAPTAFQRLAHPEGEVAASKAAADFGAVYVLSMFSTSSLEEVAAACSGPKWLHIYLLRDRGRMKAILDRARGLGFSGVVLTVDSPVHGRRLADLTSGFTLPRETRLPIVSELGSIAGARLADFVERNVDPAIGRADIERVISESGMPLIVKGIVRSDDARIAASLGARAVVISNHGGRQLDRAPSALEALADAVREGVDNCDLLIDGSVRWGTDVVTAMGLGAKGVLIGRPILWGLAVGGEAGVRSVLATLRAEIVRALTLCGVNDWSELRHAKIVRRKGEG